ncbi:MAG: hypothetical protein RL711_408 [Bacteroidota bacterium]|jgi:hypothetical protein
MKKYSLLVSILIALFFTACSEKKQTIQNFSPDKKISIVVEGKKPNALDPWVLDFKITAGDKKGSLSTEFHSSELTAENIKFNWLEADHCELTLTEQDDVKRIFLIRVDSDGIQMQEQPLTE